jgi:hypothetical protein
MESERATKRPFGMFRGDLGDTSFVWFDTAIS